MNLKRSNESERLTYWIVVAGVWTIVCAIAFTIMVMVWAEMYAGAATYAFMLVPFFLQKLHVIVGVPAAAIVAFIIVALLKQTSGSIEFSGLGFRLHGAVGPVVLWLACFLAMIFAIKLLWGDLTIPERPPWQVILPRP